MPRLLLVDENPSIRRSAEILLGGTDVQLVALSSAEEALAEVASGTLFDVALIHAFLPGSMDGWGLLTHLRSHPSTAHLPIALMAGVLKEVDPVQIAEAPIQGFLRKPIELGNLRDRLATIMATPVPDFLPPNPPATETVPGASLESMLPLPETRAEETPMEREDDILLLEVEDLFPGESTPVPLPEDMAHEDLEFETPGGGDSLELEELDLEALRILEPSSPTQPESKPEPEPFSFSEPTPQEMPTVPEVQATWEEVPPPAPEPVLEFPAEPAPVFLSEVEASEGTVDLPDLGTDLGSELDLEAETPIWTSPEVFAPVAVAAGVGVAAIAGAAAFAPSVEPPVEPAPALEASALVEPQPPSPRASAPPSGEAQALVSALIADPAALDALCRAVVAELGDRALREIAWEIMPDLAKKLPN